MGGPRLTSVESGGGTEVVSLADWAMGTGVDQPMGPIWVPWAISGAQKKEMQGKHLETLGGSACPECSRHKPEKIPGPDESTNLLHLILSPMPQDLPSSLACVGLCERVS